MYTCVLYIVIWYEISYSKVNSHKKSRHLKSKHLSHDNSVHTSGLFYIHHTPCNLSLIDKNIDTLYLSWFKSCIGLYTKNNHQLLEKQITLRIHRLVIPELRHLYLCFAQHSASPKYQENSHRGSFHCQRLHICSTAAVLVQGSAGQAGTWSWRLPYRPPTETGSAVRI